MSDDRVSVLVCRGCCCGTVAKHPDVDHAGHLAMLREALGTDRRTKLFTVDCLGHCERSNVVAVRRGSQRRWLGDMLADADIETLAAWLADGARAVMPASLLRHEFDPDSVDDTVAEMLAADIADVVGIVCRSLTPGSGVWTTGALTHRAGFMPGDPCSVSVEGNVVCAVEAVRTIRFDLPDDARLFVVNRPDTATPLFVALASIAVPIDASSTPMVAITDRCPGDDSGAGNGSEELNLPSGFSVPNGFRAAAVFYPTPGWTPTDGAAWTG